MARSVYLSRGLILELLMGGGVVPLLIISSLIFCAVYDFILIMSVTNLD